MEENIGQGERNNCRGQQRGRSQMDQNGWALKFNHQSIRTNLEYNQYHLLKRETGDFKEQMERGSPKNRSPSKIESMQRNGNIPDNQLAEDLRKDFQISEAMADKMQLCLNNIELEMMTIQQLAAKDTFASIAEKHQNMKTLLRSHKVSDCENDSRANDLVIENKQLKELLGKKDSELEDMKKELSEALAKKEEYKAKAEEFNDGLKVLEQEMMEAKRNADKSQQETRRLERQIELVKGTEKDVLLNSLLAKVKNMGNIKISPGNEDIVALIQSMRCYSDSTNSKVMTNMSQTPEEDRQKQDIPDKKQEADKVTGNQIQVEEQSIQESAQEFEVFQGEYGQSYYDILNISQDTSAS